MEGVGDTILSTGDWHETLCCVWEEAGELNNGAQFMKVVRVVLRCAEPSPTTTTMWLGRGGEKTSLIFQGAKQYSLL